ncbi:MAG: polymer-forming cytoskeletal protein [Bacteroidales bacterium]
MAKNTMENDSNAINIIGVGTEITGDINTNGDIRIDGFLSGNIITEGKLVVGETGKIKGEVDCKNSEVLGMIEGKIKVKELLTLKSSARIYGDIITKKLSIEPGSLFTGNCNMNDEALSDIKPKDSKVEKKGKEQKPTS